MRLVVLLVGSIDDVLTYIPAFQYRNHSKKVACAKGTHLQRLSLSIQHSDIGIAGNRHGSIRLEPAAGDQQGIMHAQQACLLFSKQLRLQWRPRPAAEQEIAQDAASY